MCVCVCVWVGGCVPKHIEEVEYSQDHVHVRGRQEGTQVLEERKDASVCVRVRGCKL